MRRLKFIYKRRLEFENAVTNHYFSIKCVPVQNEMQKLEHFAFQINPQVQYFEAKDAFLNDVYHGCICESHHYFEFQASGAVIVKNGPYKDERLTALLKYPSPYTEVEGQLKVFTDELVLPTAYSALDQAYFLMNKVYEEMNYVSQITNIHTTASQAFALRKGVCQDYAHILLALCRKIGIPAKYVAGFMIGEGKTHAWVEVYSGGMWYGLDHVRMMQTGYEDVGLVNDFELKYAIIRKPKPYDTTTLNYNWQIWNTQAFSIYANKTDTIDESAADEAVHSVLRFLKARGIISCKPRRGFVTTTLYEEQMLSIKTTKAGIYKYLKKPGEEVYEGEILAHIIDPYVGKIIGQVRAPKRGVVFFVYANSLIMEQTVAYKLIVG